MVYFVEDTFKADEGVSVPIQKVVQYENQYNMCAGPETCMSAIKAFFFSF